MLLFLDGYHSNNKNITVVFEMCQTIYPQNLFVPIRSTDENIQDCLLLNCAFIISDVTQSIVSQFMQNFKKTTFSVFLSFILVELSKFLSLNLNVSRTTLADFDDFDLILQDFGRPFR